MKFRYGVPIVTSGGYLQTYNKNTGKREMLHRVIWEALKGKIPKGLTIDHINGKRNDNRIENLQLLTLKANSQRQLKGSARFRKALAETPQLIEFEVMKEEDDNTESSQTLACTGNSCEIT